MAETKLVPAVQIVDLGESTISDPSKTVAQFTDWPGLPDGMVPVLAMCHFTIGGLPPTGSLTAVHHTVSPVISASEAEPVTYTSSPWFYNEAAGGSAAADLSIPSAPAGLPALYISDNVKLDDVEIQLICIPTE